MDVALPPLPVGNSGELPAFNLHHHIAPGSSMNRSAASLIILALTATASAAESPTPRVVDCDQPVQSRKRGLCANQLAAADFTAMAPGVSWFYNWHFTTSDMPPAGVPVEFVPMAWGAQPETLPGLEAYLAAGHKPRVVLGINEPNLRGQALMPPADAAALFTQIKAITDKYHVPLIAPNMAIGSAPKDSVTALDPLEKKDVTYTFMGPYLKAFLHFLGTTEVAGLGVHSYKDLGELQWVVGMMHKEYQRPVWVTEYAQWTTASDSAARDYLIQATDLLERTPYVDGYAWFKERVGKNPRISLFSAESGKLTPLGETYVAMPVHDADLYYRIPGRLQAERYVAFDKATIHATGDGEGFLDMTITGNGGWIDYNVQVDAAGTYGLTLRASGKDGLHIEILSGAAVLARVTSDQHAWQDCPTQVKLPAGAQTLRLRSTGKDTAINWLAFVKR